MAQISQRVELWRGANESEFGEVTIGAKGNGDGHGGLGKSMSCMHYVCYAYLISEGILE